MPEPLNPPATITIDIEARVVDFRMPDSAVMVSWELLDRGNREAVDEILTQDKGVPPLALRVARAAVRAYEEVTP